MSALIQSIEHGLSVAASDLVKVAHFVQGKIVPALRIAGASASEIEVVAGFVSPQAVSIERVGFALLGLALKAIEDADAIVSAQAGQRVVTLDAALVADLKEIAGAVKAAVPK